MYDGNVAVYNLQTNPTDPIYVSKGHGKHSDIVWEVKWGPDMQDGEINFYSISGDGRVFNWVLMQSKLAITTIITLFLDKDYIGGPEGNNIKLKGMPTFMIWFGYSYNTHSEIIISIHAPCNYNGICFL